MRSRILRGMGAGSYSQAITILLQLLSIPLFLRVWTLDEYGVWLVLSTLPTYLTLSDFGITTAVGSRLTMLMQTEQVKEGRALVSGLLAILVLMSLGIVALSAVVGLSLNNLGAVPPDQLITAVLLVLGVCLAQMSGAFEGVLRATNRLPLAVASSANTRLMEWAGYMAGLFTLQSLPAVALFGLFGRFIGTTVIAVLATRGEGAQLIVRPALVNARLLRPLVKPALGGLSYSLASALTLQGSTIVAATFLSPAAAAIFATYRTISRVLVQGTAIVSHAAWPEFSRLFAAENLSAFHKLERRITLITVAGSVVVGAAIIAVSPTLLTIWTHGTVPFEMDLSVLLIAYAIVASSWHTPRVALFAVNGQAKFGFWILIVALVGVPIMIGATNLCGLTGLATSIVITEALMAGCCIISLRTFKNGMRKPKR